MATTSGKSTVREEQELRASTEKSSKTVELDWILQEGHTKREDEWLCGDNNCLWEGTDGFGFLNTRQKKIPHSKTTHTHKRSHKGVRGRDSDWKEVLYFFNPRFSAFFVLLWFFYFWKRGWKKRRMKQKKRRRGRGRRGEGGKGRTKILFGNNLMRDVDVAGREDQTRIHPRAFFVLFFFFLMNFLFFNRKKKEFVRPKREISSRTNQNRISERQFSFLH